MTIHISRTMYEEVEFKLKKGEFKEEDIAPGLRVLREAFGNPRVISIGINVETRELTHREFQNAN